MSNTPPGQVFCRDFRTGSASSAHDRPTIKLLQWNIERGYQLPGIIVELKLIDADVISLQEVDVGCKRSGSLDTGLAIAEALQLNYIFLCEFEELESPLRDTRSQGGGIHGNAILTKFDITQWAVVEHRAHPVDWNNPTHALARREPRRGRRAVLRAILAAPQGPLVVYCAHLEVFCGLLSRVAQLADIFEDARTMVDQGFCHQAILGDLNTMAHGVARLSPNYCCDHMRFRSVGLDEAVVWERHVLSEPDPQYDPDQDGSRRPARESSPAQPASAEAAAEAGGASAAGWGAAPDPAQPNRWLLKWGLDAQVARAALNPGFSDPFPAATTVTLDNPSYRWFGLSLMKGKLDWALVRRLAVHGTAVGNNEYALSDHKWLAADVSFA